MLRKRWFSDEGLSGVVPFWPIIKEDSQPLVPYWVPDEDADLWKGMGEIERAYYYYAFMYEHLPDAGNLTLVDYDALMDNPRRVFARLACDLECEFGEKTEELLAQASDPAAKLETSLEDVNESLRRRVCAVVERCPA